MLTVIFIVRAYIFNTYPTSTQNIPNPDCRPAKPFVQKHFSLLGRHTMYILNETTEQEKEQTRIYVIQQTYNYMQNKSVLKIHFLQLLDSKSGCTINQNQFGPMYSRNRIYWHNKTEGQHEMKFILLMSVFTFRKDNEEEWNTT